MVINISMLKTERLGSLNQKVFKHTITVLSYITII